MPPKDTENAKTKEEQNIEKKQNKFIQKTINQINNILGQTSLDIYGTDRTSDAEILNNKFQQILQNELISLTNKDSEDFSSFINRLYADDRKASSLEEIMQSQFSSATGANFEALKSAFFEIYKNRMIEQADLHEVSSQLIELSEAILVTRDAIISADVVEGRMNRTLKFDNSTNEGDAKTTIELMEKRLGLQKKIKNFIVPKTLEYGSYYIYTIPYKEMFKSFLKYKNNSKFYKESVLTESFDDKKHTYGERNSSKGEYDTFMESFYKKFKKENNLNVLDSKVPDLETFKSDMGQFFNNISVCNNPLPLPFMEEGLDSITEIQGLFVNETDGDNSSLFEKINKSDSSEGVKINKDDKELDVIQDCYIKLMEPIKVLPVKIMSSTIGYYYVYEEKINPIGGSVSNSLYFTEINSDQMQKSIVDGIAERIVKSFDKKFLLSNLKFKKEIADCIQYHNLNHSKLKFQFIPVEYMNEFKIDEDENDEGQSVIKKSLFYAKLYLMILLFRILSILLYSNDQRVNYIRSSGIDKNVINKVQEIARIKQNRQINIMDLFSYTTLINKIGAGTEMYIPVGRNSERPMETDILQGQEVQTNSDLLELLKNSYILGTGVPATIINYLQEADFAAQIAQNNTKWNARIINYQLDFNSSITDLYKKLMKWTTTLDDQIIDGFEFSFVPPKTVASNTRSEMIQQYQTLQDFMITILFDDPNAHPEDMELPLVIKHFKQLLIKEQLPSINMSEILELEKKARLLAKQEKLTPNPLNGDEDDDLDDMDMNAP